MRTCFVLLAVLCFSSVAVAQTGICSESAVKGAIAKGSIQTMSDAYFFSGALDKPVVGNAARSQAGGVVAATRKNESEKSTTDRVVADKAGDMAYEYGSVHISYDDVKTGKHKDFTSAYLRVWTKDNWTCKVAAEMAEPENNQADAKK